MERTLALLSTFLFYVEGCCTTNLSSLAREQRNPVQSVVSKLPPAHSQIFRETPSEKQMSTLKHRSCATCKGKSTDQRENVSLLVSLQMFYSECHNLVYMVCILFCLYFLLGCNSAFLHKDFINSNKTLRVNLCSPMLPSNTSHSDEWCIVMLRPVAW